MTCSFFRRGKEDVVSPGMTKMSERLSFSKQRGSSSLYSSVGGSDRENCWSYCPSFPRFSRREKKQKMVEAYFFEDDSDDPSGSDVSPLVRRPRPQSVSNTPHSHIFTGYLSVLEVILLVAYAAALVGMSLYEVHNPDGLLCYKLVAYFSMIHVAIWAIVGVFDRVVQWRHQVLRRKGYLKFYRNMRNIRRVPFIVVSIANAAVLLMVSLLYFYQIHKSPIHKSLYPVDFLYIIVGLELLFTLPCLIYYIVRATLFNMAKQPPDVISDTFTGSESPTSSVTAVGFRDGEDLDELLERQADMIRYLQQHNANLGRRILELQAGAME